MSPVLSTGTSELAEEASSTGELQCSLGVRASEILDQERQINAVIFGGGDGAAGRRVSDELICEFALFGSHTLS